jgi:hypothetical protein
MVSGKCRVLSGCPPRAIPKVVGFGLGCAETWNSKVQTTQDLDRFRPICVMPYVLYDGLYCLDVDLVILVLRGSLPALIYPEGQGYMNPSLILA